MKKILLSMILALIAMCSWAYDVEIDGIYYTLDRNDRTAIVTWGDQDYSGDVIIPSSVEYNGITFPVVEIGGTAFWRCYSLTSVSIPNSVSKIDGNPFMGCTSLPVEGNLRYADSFLVEAVDKTLSEYTIKEGTRFIGYDAFENCTKMTSVNIPNSVKSNISSTVESCI